VRYLDRSRTWKESNEQPVDLEIGIDDIVPNGAGQPPDDEPLDTARVTGLRPACMHAGALRSVVTHGVTDTLREVGGLLVGRVSLDGSGKVDVLAAIPAEHNRESAARLTFTHESWDQMLADMEQDHPGCRVVGWYHTHPRHGIFLSEHDLFIHRNFFSSPNQMAMVFDPTTGDLGLFGWSGDRVVRYPCVPVCTPAGDEMGITRVTADSLQNTGRITVDASDSFLDLIADLGESATREFSSFFQELGAALETAFGPIDKALDNGGQADGGDDRGKHIDVRA